MPAAEQVARAAQMQEETLQVTTALRSALGYLNGDERFQRETADAQLSALSESERRNLQTYVRTLILLLRGQVDVDPQEFWRAVWQLRAGVVEPHDLAILEREVEIDLSALAFFDRLSG
jgi:hypothetical protein